MVGQRIILKDKIGGLLVNSGNANAFTGRRGEEDLDHILNYVAEMLNCEKGDRRFIDRGDWRIF